MIKRDTTLYIDIIFCVLLLPALIMLLPIDRWLQSSSLFVVLLFGWLYLLYFVNRWIVMPLIFRGNNDRVISVLIIFISVCITYLLTRYQIHHPPHLAPPVTPKRITAVVHIQLQGVWYLYFLVITFSAVVTLLSQLHRKNIEQQSIEFEKKKAELALYKAQINPHFLFNTLNTLLGMVITKSPDTEEAFLRFTNLMKYMCTNSTTDRVSICTEIEYIEQYIELQRYRLNKRTQVEFSLSGVEGCEQLTIAPMLLITFVENAMKYGASSHEDSKIKIEIVVTDGHIELSTSNPILTQPIEKEQGSGIGITNCKSRLELLYPQSYTLNISDSGAEYSVLLKIKLS